jgi:hypothetical protein
VASVPTKIPKEHTDHDPAEQLANLFKKLTEDAGFRKEFRDSSDPQQTAKDHGLEIDKLNHRSPQVIHTLAKLSLGELMFLKEIDQTMIGADLYVETNPKLMML